MAIVRGSNNAAEIWDGDGTASNAWFRNKLALFWTTSGISSQWDQSVRVGYKLIPKRTFASPHCFLRGNGYYLYLHNHFQEVPELALL